MRLIDADALKQRINAAFWSEVGKIIDSAPTIDIVHCSECVYSNGVGKYCQNDHFVKEDTFCSYGEREGK